MKRLCVGDIDPVEKGKQVQQADERKNMPVDAGHHLLFGGMRWTFDAELVILGADVAILKAIPVKASWRCPAFLAADDSIAVWTGVALRC